MVDVGYIIWNPDPEIFRIGFYAISWYGASWTLSFFSGYVLYEYFFKQEGYNTDKVSRLVIYGGLGGAIGARLGEVIFYHPQYFLEHPSEILMTWKGGMGSHGGVVGCILGLWLFSRKNEETSFLWLVDMAAIGCFLTAGMIRLGNLMNQEIIGKVTRVPWAFIFPAVDDQPRHPQQLYESLFCALCFMVFWCCYKNWKSTRPGIYIGMFFTFPFLGRILLEFNKETDSSLVEAIGLSNTQLLSVPAILLGMFILWKVRRGVLEY